MLLQKESVLEGIPKIHLSVRRFLLFEREWLFHQCSQSALFLLSVSFCSIVNGTFPLKMLSAHSHKLSTRLRSSLVMRCLRIHGFVFCKCTIWPACFFKRWETMLLPQHLMQEWKETGCNILLMTWLMLSVPHRERWRLSISGYPRVLFHIDHNVAVRTGRGSSKGFQEKLRSPGIRLVC